MAIIRDWVANFNIYPYRLDEFDAEAEIVDHVVGLLGGIAAGAGIYVEVSVESCSTGLLQVGTHSTVDKTIRTRPSNDYERIAWSIGAFEGLSGGRWRYVESLLTDDLDNDDGQYDESRNCHLNLNYLTP